MRIDELRGGTAVITGGGSGIGFGIAEAAAARGMNLVLADISDDRLSESAGKLRDTGVEVLTKTTDVRDIEQVRALADAAYDRFGRVTLLANNAGLESGGYLWEVPVEEWTRVIDVNLKGVFHGISAFVPRMGADPRPSHIVNTASLAAVGMMRRMSAYGTSKHAVQSLTESLYLECQQVFPQIGVSVMNPGEVATRIFEDMPVHDGMAAEAEFFRDRLKAGMAPRELGDILFEAVLANEFWILPHREMFHASATKRAEYLAGLRRPEAPTLPGDA